MEMDPNLTREDFLQRVLPQIAYIQESVLFWIGDALVDAEDKRKWGELYADSKDLGRYDAGTLRNAKWVCSRIQLSRRRDKLTWTHHQEIAAIDDVEQQDYWLEKAATENLTTRALREGIRMSRPGAEPNRQPTPALIGYGEIKNIEDLTAWSEKQNLEEWDDTRVKAMVEYMTPMMEFYKKLLAKAGMAVA